MAQVPSTETLRRAFDAFDVDKSGTISVTEMYQVMNQAGCKASPARVAELIRVFDSNNSGVMEFDEFVELITNASR